MPTRLQLRDFKAALFDVDGTLVNSLEMIIKGLGETYEKFADRRPSDQELLALIGMPLSKQLKLFSSTEPSQARLNEMTEYVTQRFEAHKNLVVEFKPAVDALELAYRSGLKTALVTSKSTIELIPFLERFRGTPFAMATVCASDVLHPKPAPDSALLACEKLGVEPNQAVFIGDSTFDMQCAKSAGCATVAVTYGAGQPDALARAEPDMTLDSPEDLLQWAQQSFLLTHAPQKN